jgi:transposase
MTKHINLHKNYTLNGGNYRLKLPLKIDYMIPDSDSVRLLSQFVVEMDLTNLYSTYSRIRENQATPRQMLKVSLYSYMNKHFSSRLMEQFYRRDVNFMYLLEGSPAPDHATFARFRSIHFAPCTERIMAEMTNFLHDIGEVSGDAIFIDGTKIEACANKYTFVWKKVSIKA